MVPFIHDEYFVEFLSQIAFATHIVDQTADIHMFRYRHKVPAHQAASGFFRISERAFNRRAVFGIDLGKDCLLIVFVQILDQLNRIIGFELLDNGRNRFRRERFHHVFAHVVVQLGDHFRTHQVCYRSGELSALILVKQLQQVGDVSWVKRLHQIIHGIVVTRLKCVAYAADIFGF